MRKKNDYAHHRSVNSVCQNNIPLTIFKSIGKILSLLINNLIGNLFTTIKAKIFRAFKQTKNRKKVCHLIFFSLRVKVSDCYI